MDLDELHLSYTFMKVAWCRPPPALFLLDLPVVLLPLPVPPVLLAVPPFLLLLANPDDELSLGTCAPEFLLPYLCLILLPGA